MEMENTLNLRVQAAQSEANRPGDSLEHLLYYWCKWQRQINLD